MLKVLQLPVLQVAIQASFFFLPVKHPTKIRKQQPKKKKENHSKYKLNNNWDAECWTGIEGLVEFFISADRDLKRSCFLASYFNTQCSKRSKSRAVTLSSSNFWRIFSLALFSSSFSAFRRANKLRENNASLFKQLTQEKSIAPY